MKFEKLLQKFRANPLPADFRFSECQIIMEHFGYQKRERAGSRVVFVHQTTKAVLQLHKPHPGDVMPKASVKTVRDFLEGKGHIVRD